MANHYQEHLCKGLRLAILSTLVLTVSCSRPRSDNASSENSDSGAIVADMKISTSKQPEKKIAEFMRLAVENLVNLSADFYDGQLPESSRRNSDGKELSSWRFFTNEVFPVMPPKDMASPRFQKHWKSKENTDIRMLPNKSWCWTQAGLSNGWTNCMAITGPGTAFDPAKPRRRLTEIPNSTILLVEVNAVSVHWMEPGDASLAWLQRQLDREPPGENLGISDAGFHVAFKDGEVRYLKRSIPYDVLGNMLLLKRAAEVVDKDQLLKEYIVGE